MIFLFLIVLSSCIDSHFLFLLTSFFTDFKDDHQHCRNKNERNRFSGYIRMYKKLQYNYSFAESGINRILLLFFLLLLILLTVLIYVYFFFSHAALHATKTVQFFIIDYRFFITRLMWIWDTFYHA